MREDQDRGGRPAVVRRARRRADHRVAGGVPAALGCGRLPNPGRGRAPARRGDRRLESRRRLADAEAFCAPIYARMIRPSPAAYAAGELRLIAIEGEIAFRLGHDLPPRAQPYERSEVTRDATLHPAIEVVEFPFCRSPRARPAVDARRQLREWRARPRRRGDGTGRARPRRDADRDHRGRPAVCRQQCGVARDPVAALVDFANLMRTRGGARPGFRHHRVVDRHGLHPPRHQDQRRFRAARPGRHRLRRRLIPTIADACPAPHGVGHLLPNTTAAILPVLCRPLLRSSLSTPRRPPDVGWFFRQKLLAARLSRPVPLPDELRGRPMPDRRRILGDLRALFAQDWRNIEAGYYAPPADRAGSPVAAMRRAVDFFADLAAVEERRHGEPKERLLHDPPPGAYPRYFLQKFHFQSDGYLSDASAERYDHQVEVLFGGGAAAMRRQALVPLRQALAGRRVNRCGKVRLLDLACGTGSFLREVKVNWPRLSVTGLDLRHIISRSAPGIGAWSRTRLVEGTAEAMPFADGEFDVVTCIICCTNCRRGCAASRPAKSAAYCGPAGP